MNKHYIIIMACDCKILVHFLEKITMVERSRTNRGRISARKLMSIVLDENAETIHCLYSLVLTN